MLSEESIYLASGNGDTERSYRRLRVWNEAADLVMEVYRLTDAFPQDESEGLTLQIRQAAVTIPARIANGSARFDTSEGLDQLSIAAASLAQVETLLELARRLRFAAPDVAASLKDRCAEVSHHLNNLCRFLEESP